MMMPGSQLMLTGGGASGFQSVGGMPGARPPGPPGMMAPPMGVAPPPPQMGYPNPNSPYPPRT